MKFIWRYLYRKIQNAGNDDHEAVPSKIATVRSRDSFDSDNGLNMKLYKANGGRIVAFSHYDRKTDRESRSVYIITDEQDFERELSKIITLENMRG